MRAFDLGVLMAPAVLIVTLTFVVSLNVTRNAALAVAAAATKGTLFLVYFGSLFDGTYTFLDDISYLEGGAALLRDGFGLSQLSSQWELLVAIGGGDHVAYYIYNALAFELFGEGYYAPVACNILLTVPIAVLGARLARSELMLSQRQSRWLYVFLLLHPDVLAWSTVMNGKDTLLLLLHVLLLQACADYLGERRRRAILLGASVCSVLVFLRFYVPLFFLAALLASALMTRPSRGYTLRVCAGAALLGGSAFLVNSQFDYALAVLSDTLVNPTYGFVRVLLTPIPFGTEKEYAFLDVPALLHWALLPFAIYGAHRIWRMRTPFARFLLIYLFSFLALYAVIGELQGPRHRVQLDFAIAVLQFVGIHVVRRKLTFLDTRQSRHAGPPFPMATRL
jgi:hypothetical protein